MLIQFPAELVAQPVERWADWFVDRPASSDKPDSEAYDAESDWLDESDLPLPEGETPEVFLLERIAELHERYAEWASLYSAAQLSQGLWAMFDFPCYLGELFFDEGLPFAPRVRALRSLVTPYQVYVAGWDPSAAMPHGWNMLWDLVYGVKEPQREIANVALDCLQEILALPDVRCQGAALHGLNHLKHPDRPAVVQRWIDRYGKDWDREWLEACRDGKAQ